MFDIRIVFLLGWCGDILGDLIFYTIGRYGFHLFSKKTRIDTTKKESFIARLDALIHENLALAILIIKFTPYAPPIGLAYIGKI
jgi:membrane protein DedA with SNARE-associated domain